MPNPDQQKKGFDWNFNVLLVVLVVAPLLGSWWMRENGIATGATYFFMFLGSMALVTLATIVSKGDQLPRIAKFIRAPFASSLLVATGVYLAGWLLPIIVEFILWIFRITLGVTWTVTSFSVPLFSKGRFIGQSYSAVAFQQNMDWKIFNFVFNASATEEITFSFAIMLVGVLIGIFLLKTLFKGEKAWGMKKETFVIGFAILFASALFMGAHQLNATYVGWMFAIAFFFKLITLIGIYVWGLFLTFVIGYHASNNFLYLIQTDGGVAVLNGLVSWIGLGILLFFTVLIWYLARNWGEFIDKFKKYLFS